MKKIYIPLKGMCKIFLSEKMSEDTIKKSTKEFHKKNNYLKDSIEKKVEKKNKASDVKEIAKYKRDIKCCNGEDCCVNKSNHIDDNCGMCNEYCCIKKHCYKGKKCCFGRYYTMKECCLTKKGCCLNKHSFINKTINATEKKIYKIFYKRRSSGIAAIYVLIILDILEYIVIVPSMLRNLYKQFKSKDFEKKKLDQFQNWLLNSIKKYSLKPVIIDTDPGADDIIALLIALSAKDTISILGISSVGGNVELEHTSRNTRMVNEWVERSDVSIWSGCSRPIFKSALHAVGVHGKDGAPGIKIFEPKFCTHLGSSTTCILSALRKATPNSITIATLGPQSNLASALMESPSLALGIKEVVLMGGAHLNGGNVTPNSEFNIFTDPHALYVLLSSKKPITIVSLDVTQKMLSNHRRIESFRNIGNNAGKVTAQVLDKYIQHDINVFNLPGGPIHDATTIAYVLNPNLFKKKKISVRVDIRPGYTFASTVVDYYGVTKNKKNATWVLQGDSDNFFKILTNQLSKLP